MTIKEMWDQCKGRAAQGTGINSGGLGRLKIAGRTYVGGFFLNLVLLYSPETLGQVKYNTRSRSLPAPKITLSPDEYCLYLTR